MQIRTASTSDYESLIQLFQEFALFIRVPEKMNNSVAQLMDEKDYFHALVVENDQGTIIGFVSYFYAYYTWTGKSLYMDDLYVKPNYRGQGIGTALLQKLIDLGKKEKCKKLKWQVTNWNHKAQEFYKKMGASIDDVEINCDLLL